MSYIPSAIVSQCTGGIYGLKRFVDGYAGNCVNLRRGDATTSDFGFAAGTDDIDTAAIVAWNALNSGGPSNLYINTLYDQSGSGNDLLAPATLVNKPRLELTGFYQQTGAKSGLPVDGMPIIYFNDPITTASGPCHFECATGTFSNKNFQFVYAGRWNQQYYGQQHEGPAVLNIQLGLSVTTDCIFYSSWTSRNTSSPVSSRFAVPTCAIGGAFPLLTTTYNMTQPNTSYLVVTCKHDGTFPRVKHGRYRVVQGATTGTTVTGLTGFRIGRSFGTTFSNVGAAFGFTVGTALNDADEDTLMRFFSDTFDASYEPEILIAAQGDSITATYMAAGGFYTGRTYSWFRAVQQTFGRRAACYNFAESGGHFGMDTTPYGPLPGASAGTVAVQFGGQPPDGEDKIVDARQFKRAVLIIFAGTNDLALYGAGNSTEYAYQVHGALERYCRGRRAAGYTDIIIVESIPRNIFEAAANGVQNLQWRNYNNLMRRHWREYADDFVETSQFNWLPGGSFSTYYQDSIHPNLAGQAILAQLILPAVQRRLHRRRSTPIVKIASPTPRMMGVKSRRSGYR